MEPARSFGRSAKAQMQSCQVRAAGEAGVVRLLTHGTVRIRETVQHVRGRRTPLSHLGKAVVGQGPDTPG